MKKDETTLGAGYWRLPRRRKKRIRGGKDRCKQSTRTYVFSYKKEQKGNEREKEDAKTVKGHTLVSSYGGV